MISNFKLYINLSLFSDFQILLISDFLPKTAIMANHLINEPASKRMRIESYITSQEASTSFEIAGIS